MSGGFMDPNNGLTPPTPTSTQSSQCSSHSSDAPPNSSTTSSPPPPSKPPSFPSREDCWSPEATFTLIEAWGQRYLYLKRGNLRQNHWQDVAAAVNSLHRHSTKLPRTDIQCKNRIDTVKKKYKIEKSRVSKSAGNYLSPWPFFALLDSFIGDSFKPSPAVVSTRRRKSPALPPPPSSVPVGPRSKRPMSGRAHVWVNEAVSKRRSPDQAEEESDTSRHSFRDEWAKEGFLRIAEAIGRCGEIYKRVEEEKLRQMIELEKQRMLFAKDLEIQRMKLIAESQVQLERIKNARRFVKGPRCR